MNDFITVYIDNFPSTYWKICLTERPHIPIPERQYISDKVLGRNGAFHSSYAFDDMQVRLTFNYLEDGVDFKVFKQQMPHIRKWLQDGEKLEFSDEPNTSYIIQAVSFDDNVLNDMVEYGEFDVTLTLAPFGRIEEEPIEFPLVTINGRKTVDSWFYNATVEDSQPTIVIQTTNNFVLWLDVNATTDGDPLRETQYVQTSLAEAYFKNYKYVTFYIDSQKGIINYRLGTQTGQNLLTAFEAPKGMFQLNAGSHRITVRPNDYNSEFQTNVNFLKFYTKGLK